MQQIKYSLYIGDELHVIDSRSIEDHMSGKNLYRVMDNNVLVDEGSSCWYINLRDKIVDYIHKLDRSYAIELVQDSYRRNIQYDLVPYSGDNWLSDCVYDGALTCHP